MEVKLNLKSKAINLKFSMTKVAVIGAGMCGISCASYLQKNGFEVTVFEKSRGIGGRMASRRINEQVSVDHGAQYIKPYSKNFLHFLEETVRAGFASSWSPLGMEKNYIQEKKIFVGTPRMNSILKNSSNNLEINFSSKINKILSNFNKWKLVIEGIEYQKEFDIVVFAIPFHQISEIIDYEWINTKSTTAKLLSRLLAELREGMIDSVDQIENIIDSVEERQLLADIHSRELSVEEPTKQIVFCLERLRRKFVEAQIKNLEQKIINSDPVTQIRLMRERKEILSKVSHPLELKL